MPFLRFVGLSENNFFSVAFDQAIPSAQVLDRVAENAQPAASASETLVRSPPHTTDLS